MKRIANENCSYIIDATGVNYILYGLFLFFTFCILHQQYRMDRRGYRRLCSEQNGSFGQTDDSEEFSPLLLYDLSHCSSKTFCFGLPSINYHFLDRLKINRKRRSRDRNLRSAIAFQNCRSWRSKYDQKGLPYDNQNNPADDVINLRLIIVQMFNESVLPLFTARFQTPHPRSNALSFFL